MLTKACVMRLSCAPGGFPMKDALPMPGKAVSPNNITLKDGYTWEVRGCRNVLSQAHMLATRHVLATRL
jgi:hypothetical protein